MKILFDATVLAEGLRKTSNRSGIFRVACEVLREMSARPEVEVGIYASRSVVDAVNRFLASEFPGRGYRVLNCRRSSLIGRLWWRTSNHAVGRFRRLLVTVVKIWRILDDKYRHCRGDAALADGFDVFFSPAYLAPYAIRRHSTVARVTYVHDTIPKLFPQYSIFTRLGFSWNFDLIDGLREDDWCCANSECTRRDFLRFSPRLRPERVEVVPLAADGKFRPVSDAERIESVRAKYGIPAGRRYVLSLCNIAPHKNLSFTIGAFREFAATHPDCLLVLAGAKYNSFAFTEDDGDVLRIGYVDDEDVPALYCGAVAFVYLSIYEGFGLPPLEAMQCGVPVITSNVSSLPEVVADAAVTVDPRDRLAAAAAMARFADGERERADYIRRGLARSAGFSWRATCDGILAVCARAVEFRGRR